MKTSFAFALLFVTFVLISMIDFTREEEMENSGIRIWKSLEQLREWEGDCTYEECTYLPCCSSNRRCTCRGKPPYGCFCE
nr:venom protein [Lampona murina]